MKSPCYFTLLQKYEKTSPTRTELMSTSNSPCAIRLFSFMLYLITTAGASCELNMNVWFCYVDKFCISITCTFWARLKETFGFGSSYHIILWSKTAQDFKQQRKSTRNIFIHFHYSVSGLSKYYYQHHKHYVYALWEKVYSGRYEISHLIVIVKTSTRTAHTKETIKVMIHF